MAQTNEFSAERALDRIEIEHRVNQFCRAVDRKDLEALHEVFHPDAHDDHGVFKGDPDGFIEWARKRHQTIAFSSHHLSNIYIEFVDDDEAFVESYFLIWQSVTPASNITASAGSDEESYELFSSGRYADRFTRREGRWRIQTRTVLLGSSMRIDDAAGLSMAPGFAHSSRDQHDAAQVLRASLRATV